MTWLTVPNSQFQRLQNRVAAAFLQRFLSTNLCSPGLGAAPQQAETRYFRIIGNAWFFAFVYTDALPLMFRVDIFHAGTVSLGRKQQGPLGTAGSA